MSANILSNGKCLTISQKIGKRVVWAVVWSHHESGRYAAVTTIDHEHGTYDRRTEEFELDHGPCQQTSCRLLFSGEPYHWDIVHRADQMRRGELV